MKVIIAPFGGLIGAIVGGILWAKFIQWTGFTWGFIAVGIGALTGIGMLLTCASAIEPDAKKHWLMVSIGAALFSIVGIFIGIYLDVHWNALTQMTEQIMAEEPTISEEAATSIAEIQHSDKTKWELMKKRMDRFELLFGAIAVFVAFYITSNTWVRKIISKFNRI